METFTYYLIYEMISGLILGYANDTVHKVPKQVRNANLTGKLVNKTLIQIGWKLIVESNLLEEIL